MLTPQQIQDISFEKALFGDTIWTPSMTFSSR